MARAEEFLKEVEELSLKDPLAAEKLMKKRSREFREFFSLDAPLYDRFRKIVFSVKSKTTPSFDPSAFPTVATVPMNTLESMGKLYEAAKRLEQEVVYTLPAHAKHKIDALGQIEALCFFSDPSLAIFSLDEEVFLIRRQFILNAAQSFNPEVEDWMVDLQDFARKKGFKVLP
jgi:hypothetical protein